MITWTSFWSKAIRCSYWFTFQQRFNFLTFSSLVLTFILILVTNRYCVVTTGESKSSWKQNNGRYCSGTKAQSNSKCETALELLETLSITDCIGWKSWNSDIDKSWPGYCSRDSACCLIWCIVRELVLATGQGLFSFSHNIINGFLLLVPELVQCDAVDSNPFRCRDANCEWILLSGHFVAAFDVRITGLASRYWADKTG